MSVCVSSCEVSRNLTPLGSAERQHLFTCDGVAYVFLVLLTCNKLFLFPPLLLGEAFLNQLVVSDVRLKNVIQYRNVTTSTGS